MEGVLLSDVHTCSYAPFLQCSLLLFLHLLLLSVFISPLKDACFTLILLFSNCSYFDIDLIAETSQPSESVPGY